MVNEQFVKVATELVSDYARLPVGEVYVVWLSKILQNNKVLLSTTRSDGMYYEVTHNGDKEEFYLDAYKKEANIAFATKNLGGII